MMDLKELTRARGARTFTLALIDRLEEAIACYDRKNQEPALHLLEGMGPEVALLEAVTDRLRQQAQRDGDNHQRLSERLLVIIGEIEQSQEAMKKALADAEAEIARDESLIVSDKETIKNLQDDTAKLRDEIAAIRARYEEAITWCWVPFYGEYLAGRTLLDTIEGKIGRVQRAAEEMKSLAGQQEKTGKEIQRVKASLASLTQTVAEKSREEKALELQKAALEEQNKLYAKQTAFAMDMTLYYRLLGQALDGIGDGLDNVMKIARRLREQVTLYDTKGKATEATLKEALLHIGQVADDYRPANGENVHHVDYGSGGKKIGEFFQTGPKEWAVRNTEQGKIIYTFKETGRDAWSVYLSDPSRNVSIQLDLWTNKVFYSAPSAPRREQYQVLDASDRVNGWIAVVVDYGAVDDKVGSFMEVGAKRWSQVQGVQTVHHYDETSRDEWSVYLKDATRNASLHLDLWTRKVYYSDPNTPRREQYTVVGAA